MIDGKTKQKLLSEIRKIGNVYSSCLKIGVDRATYYRWKQSNIKFKKQADEAEAMGRENICDVAEYTLLQNVKKGDQRAIEYTLGHNSERYRRKQTSNVIIVHRKETPIPNTPVRTLEDLFDEHKEDSESLNDIADSMSETDTPPTNPLENQKTSDNSGSNSSSQNNQPDNST